MASGLELDSYLASWQLLEADDGLDKLPPSIPRAERLRLQQFYQDVPEKFYNENIDGDAKQLLRSSARDGLELLLD